MAHANNHLDSSDDFFTDTPPNLQPRRFLNNGASNAIVEVNSLFMLNWSILSIKILNDEANLKKLTLYIVLPYP